MRPVLVTVVGLLIVLACARGHAGPPADLWHRWLAHDPNSSLRIEHDEWDAILMRYLRIGEDGVHRVAYGEITPADRARLDDYIAHLAGLPISAYTRAEQLAFWINLYNALVVRLVVDHYPVASIEISALRLSLAAVVPGAKSWSWWKAARSPSMTSSIASCARSGAIRGSTTRSPAVPSAARI